MVGVESGQTKKHQPLKGLYSTHCFINQLTYRCKHQQLQYPLANLIVASLANLFLNLFQNHLIQNRKALQSKMLARDELKLCVLFAYDEQGLLNNNFFTTNLHNHLHPLKSTSFTAHWK